MKYFIFLIIFVSYLFSSVIESNKSIFTNEELEWIKNNPIVKVGVDEDWPPFDYINNEKNYIFRLKINVNYSIIQSTHWYGRVIHYVLA